MARPLRIEFPGALYHVISRGNERLPGGPRRRPGETAELASKDRRNLRVALAPSSVSHAVHRIEEDPERLRAIAARL